MKLGTENKKQAIAAAVLGVLLVITILYVYATWPSSTTSASTVNSPSDLDLPVSPAPPVAHKNSGPQKKQRAPQNLDPRLHLDQLAAAEQIKYEGSGRNIFVAQADVVIPTPIGRGVTDPKLEEKKNAYVLPSQAPAPPIPLKFFGFASAPGEAKRIFLSKGDDVFIAGEGEIVDRRYKVTRITNTSVDIQDVVVSGPPQSIPLTQANPS